MTSNWEKQDLLNALRPFAHFALNSGIGQDFNITITECSKQGGIVLTKLTYADFGNAAEVYGLRDELSLRAHAAAGSKPCQELQALRDGQRQPEPPEIVPEPRWRALLAGFHPQIMYAAGLLAGYWIWG